ncbi:hypothetical protein CXB51_005221 [Gossypium anomalum]|uniref:Uncharacterized protein n=1 Tax=Gossypium anomalum TaxID=47600 RepID=A0A8J6D9I4_9ROSI|nr:hypothetical protein CXB51_005221 [Gossypium anomalum]
MLSEQHRSWDGVVAVITLIDRQGNGNADVKACRPCFVPKQIKLTFHPRISLILFVDQWRRSLLLQLYVPKEQEARSSQMERLWLFLISDAATAPKISHHNHHVSASSSSPKPPNILRFKQTRTTEICEDHSLEDTASSPVNSPKGSNSKSHDMNPRKREEDQIHSFPGERVEVELIWEIGDIIEIYPEIQIEEEEEKKKKKGKKKKIEKGMKNNDCRGSKKRGLCLVRLSMLVNYFG